MQGGPGRSSWRSAQWAIQNGAQPPRAPTRALLAALPHQLQALQPSDPSPHSPVNTSSSAMRGTVARTCSPHKDTRNSTGIGGRAAAGRGSNSGVRWRLAAMGDGAAGCHTARGEQQLPASALPARGVPCRKMQPHQCAKTGHPRLIKHIGCDLAARVGQLQVAVGRGRGRVSSGSHPVGAAGDGAACTLQGRCQKNTRYRSGKGAHLVEGIEEGLTNHLRTRLAVAFAGQCDSLAPSCRHYRPNLPRPLHDRQAAGRWTADRGGASCRGSTAAAAGLALWNRRNKQQAGRFCLVPVLHRRLPGTAPTPPHPQTRCPWSWSRTWGAGKKGRARREGRGR